MRDKQCLKVSMPKAIALALLDLPEYKGMSITQVMYALTTDKLNNHSTASKEEKNNDNRD